jgi:adenosine deaminase
VYVEAFFSPTDFGHHGLTPPELALAIRRGLDRVDGTEVALVVDLVRDTGPDRAARTLDEVAEVADDAGVIGIGIGGTEYEFPPELFTDVYRSAANRGFRLTAHAGEAAGPESVWGAIRSLGVERIGHGVRTVEDPTLLAHLVDRQIPLEVCPTSNLRTGVVAGWDDHPVRQLVAAGAMVTINTDDPAMFDCTLAGEYAQLAGRFDWDGPTLRQLAQNAIDASWAADETRHRLRRLLDGWHSTG